MSRWAKVLWDKERWQPLACAPFHKPAKLLPTCEIAKDNRTCLRKENLTVMEPQNSYSRIRNSVKQIPFELVKPLPRTRPLSHCNPNDLALVRLLVKNYPQETLGQLCARIQAEHHLNTSPSNLSRALKQVGLNRSNHLRYPTHNHHGQLNK